MRPAALEILLVRGRNGQVSEAVVIVVIVVQVVKVVKHR